MANWTNARLIASGPRDAVLAFAAAALDESKRVFRADMLVGEAIPLRKDRVERVGDGVYRKRFIFRILNDYGGEHFVRVSRRYRRLTFVLVFGDPNCDTYGSAHRGGAREFDVTPRQARAIWRKHKVSLEDEDEWRFWEASWELMDWRSHWPPERSRATKAGQAPVPPPNFTPRMP